MGKEALHICENVHIGNNTSPALVITSGKGGVGKTNIAGNLALCMAAKQTRVLLFDADMGLGNLDVILNINSRYNLSHFISGQKTLEEIIYQDKSGLDIICSGSGLSNLANLNEFQRHRLVKILSKIQLNSDITIIDTGAGISNSVIAFCLAADHVLVITTPEPSAMTDAYAMIKVLTLNHYSGCISLLVNMAQSLSQGKKIFQQISKVAYRFLNIKIYEAGILLRDYRLQNAVRMRKPVVLAYPTADITKTFYALASRLNNNTKPMATASDSFFKKVVNLFF